MLIKYCYDLDAASSQFRGMGGGKVLALGGGGIVPPLPLTGYGSVASIKQPHHIWPRCVFPSQQPTTDVISALQHTATWQFYESDRQDTEEVSLRLVRCCGTHYH